MYEDLPQPKKRGKVSFMALRSALLFTVLGYPVELPMWLKKLWDFSLMLKGGKKDKKKLYPGLNYFDKIGSAGSECPQGPEVLSQERTYRLWVKATDHLADTAVETEQC